MIDISDVSVEEFEAEGIKGKAVLPVSDLKKVVIPSPPTVKMVPTNPRDAIIYLTDADVSDEMKAYAKENKVVFLCPEKADAEELAAVYNYAVGKATTLNVKKDTVSVKADEANLELANTLVDILLDDADVPDAEVLTL